jgi:ectoine hydroxylase-related dioxygenase (phytanoyl-CoA dioxygenase family)
MACFVTHAVRFTGRATSCNGFPFILRNMLTLRIHLDDVDHQNGPANVIVGSHRSMDQPGGEVRAIEVGRGDVLAIRPLVSHSSQASKPGVTRHRRVLHLEFSGHERLPEPLEWHTFLRP